MRVFPFLFLSGVRYDSFASFCFNRFVFDGHGRSVCHGLLRPAWWRRRCGGRGMMQSPAMMWGMLLRAPTVQKELNLTEDQQSKIKDLNEKAAAGMREMFAGMQDLSQEERAARRAEMGKKMEEQRKSLEGILLPNQVSRLKEIILQRRATRHCKTRRSKTVSQSPMSRKRSSRRFKPTCARSLRKCSRIKILNRRHAERSSRRSRKRLPRRQRPYSRRTRRRSSRR